MKTYTYEVIIEEGRDEFWSEITEDGKSGCDSVMTEIKTILSHTGFTCFVRLVAYSDE